MMRRDIMKMYLVLVVIISLYATASYSQTRLSNPIFINVAHLEKLHSNYLRGNNSPDNSLNIFLSSAKNLLNMKPLSVMDKYMVPPSGDKHDFVSMGPYWWPDPSKKDGLPYIRKDGERNPEYHKITDESYLTKTIEAVENLTVAFYVTKDIRYSAKAAELLRVWFINDETKMNPNMRHAQFIPGINTGRGIGLIETRYLFKITDAIVLLRTSKEWKKEDDLKITKWFENYFTWITTHKYGVNESDEKNNHGTWYDVQVSAIALFLGRDEFAKKILEETKHKRIDVQIESDGKQPRELARTKSWNYSLMNLSAFMHLSLLGEQVGIDLWNYQTQPGGSIKKALDFLLPFSKNQNKWKFKQIDKMNVEPLLPLLKMAQQKYDDRVYSSWIKRIFGNIQPYNDMGRLL